MNRAFGLPAIEILVQAVERYPVRTNDFVRGHIAIVSDGRYKVIRVVLAAVVGDVAVQSVAERVDQRVRQALSLSAGPFPVFGAMGSSVAGPLSELLILNPTCSSSCCFPSYDIGLGDNQPAESV